MPLYLYLSVCVSHLGYVFLRDFACICNCEEHKDISTINQEHLSCCLKEVVSAAVVFWSGQKSNEIIVNWANYLTTLSPYTHPCHKTSTPWPGVQLYPDNLQAQNFILDQLSCSLSDAFLTGSANDACLGCWIEPPRGDFSKRQMCYNLFLGPPSYLNHLKRGAAPQRCQTETDN